MAAQVEVTSVSDSFQLPELPGREEGESILDVGCATGVMAALFRLVFPHPQRFIRQPEIEIPLVTPVAPELIPLRRLRGMTEELDLHLLELARAEGEVARGDLVAEALAHLRDAERHPDARAVYDVLEVDEDPLGRLRPQERRILLTAQRPNDRLEHQVKLARGSQRSERLRIRTQDWGEVVYRRQRDDGPLPMQLIGLLAAEVEELERLLLDLVG